MAVVFFFFFCMCVVCLFQNLHFLCFFRDSLLIRVCGTFAVDKHFFPKKGNIFGLKTLQAGKWFAH